MAAMFLIVRRIPLGSSPLYPNVRLLCYDEDRKTQQTTQHEKQLHGSFFRKQQRRTLVAGEDVRTVSEALSQSTLHMHQSNRFEGQYKQMKSAKEEIRHGRKSVCITSENRTVPCSCDTLRHHRAYSDFQKETWTSVQLLAILNMVTGSTRRVIYSLDELSVYHIVEVFLSSQLV